MIKLRKILALVTVSILTVGLVACTKPTAESLQQYVDSENYQEIASVYEEIEEEELTKVKDAIMERYVETLDEYINGDRTEEIKEDVIARIQGLADIPAEEYKLIADVTVETINELHESTLAFRAGNVAFNNGDYDTALLEYAKVTSEDVINKSAADAKIQQIDKLKVIDIAPGMTISEGGFDITFNTFEFSYDVLPKNTSRFYTHYPADKGKVYYHVAMDVKNNNKQTIKSTNILSMQLIYNNDYKYNGFIILDETDGTGFDYANITSIQPLETRGMRLLFDIPEEIETASESVKINITIDGKTYTYTAR